jgi:hypothetical protein
MVTCASQFTQTVSAQFGSAALHHWKSGDCLGGIVVPLVPQLRMAGGYHA